MRRASASRRGMGRVALLHSPRRFGAPGGLPSLFSRISRNALPSFRESDAFCTFALRIRVPRALGAAGATRWSRGDVAARGAPMPRSSAHPHALARRPLVESGSGEREPALSPVASRGRAPRARGTLSQPGGLADRVEEQGRRKHGTPLAMVRAGRIGPRDGCRTLRTSGGHGRPTGWRRYRPCIELTHAHGLPGDGLHGQADSYL